MIEKSLLKRGRILKKYTISRKQTLTLASVVLGRSSQERLLLLLMRLHLAQPKPLLQLIQKQNHLSLLQQKKSMPKPIHQLFLLIKQKLGMLSLWTLKKLAHLLKQTVQIQPLLQQQPSKRTSLADQDTPVGTSKPSLFYQDSYINQRNS